MRFYGRLAERLGRRIALACPAGGMRVAEIRQSIVAQGGEGVLLEPGRARAVVGDVLVGEDFRVRTGSTVELLPPLSGG